MSDLSSLPSVERLLQTARAGELMERFGRPLTLRAVRDALQESRERLTTRVSEGAPSVESILAQSEGFLTDWTSFRTRPVINATGVILHTNLGRAPLSENALLAMEQISRGYSNLELDLATGKRGGRAADIGVILRMLTGAEASLVVNNNAAAVLLTLTALAARKRVAIARSQLVEIGGGFRMPDVMRQSGARLTEVGTTNKVRLSDYSEAFHETAVVLRAHRSNFKMIGFTEEPEFAELVQAAHQAGQVVIDDLGSGALLDTSAFGLAHEPTVQESVEAGADMVCFSGDKLLGGPQAGIIVGRAELVSRVSKHPLARTVRVDKISLAGLAATLMHYLRDDALSHVPVWQMISMPAEAARGRAEKWAQAIGRGNIEPAESTLGGGSMPGESMPTFVLALGTPRAEALGRNLRSKDPPIVARIEKGKVLLDPRTVQTWQDEALVANLRASIEETV